VSQGSLSYLWHVKTTTREIWTLFNTLHHSPNLFHEPCPTSCHVSTIKGILGTILFFGEKLYRWAALRISCGMLKVASVLSKLKLLPFHLISNWSLPCIWNRERMECYLKYLSAESGTSLNPSTCLHCFRL